MEADCLAVCFFVDCFLNDFYITLLRVVIFYILAKGFLLCAVTVYVENKLRLTVLTGTI
tara:strand:- start:497 stop:673 length:177 start_codon:yes stop_codon:yes gene_type:complete